MSFRGTPLAAQVEGLESRQLLTVTYHAGAIIPHVATQDIFLGSNWKSDPNLQTTAAKLDQFMSIMVQSPFMDMMGTAGYGIGRGSFSPGFTDNTVLVGSIDDVQIRNEIQNLISTSQVQDPNSSRLYMVYVEPGIVITQGTASSATTFLGYHGAFAGVTAGNKLADIRYAVMSYPGAPNFANTQYGMNTDLNFLTFVSSHELGEAVTDPNVNYKELGWYDVGPAGNQFGGEVGDLAVAFYPNLSATIAGFKVTDLADQNDNLLIPQTPLTAPQRLTVAATSTSTATLTWNLEFGALGYNVFRMVAGTPTYVTTLGPAATSYQATGLNAGTKETFQVFAFSGTGNLSSTASVNMPVALTATNPTTTAFSSTTGKISWNSVAGAQGYRVFVLVNGQPVLLGTVNSATLSLALVGLKKNSITLFMVEAFHGTVIADSGWIALTTPA
jgi:hypothetical protein